ncbi:MAG TPA: hypothetical protein IAD26_07475 [Candidatus Limenecus avicola]|uniref:Uncharacterized protein n=1 Tax=Candidatus Limenecus avicola TaxID=2840847 RepID=A0A9D1N1I9_9CLOT|nr:hypothetical protein [Candidatus Limenecus avicola]
MATFVIYMFYAGMFVIAKQKNLLHLFKKKSISAEKLDNYLQQFPKTGRNIGALPYDWIKSVNPENRALVTKQVQDTFTSFSRETAPTKGKSKIFGWEDVDPELFAAAHKKLVDSLKRILKRDDISVSYAGSGAVKNCHRLDVGDYSYALSAFRDENAAKKGFEDYYLRAHGRGNEPQNALTAYRQGSHGRFAKPFTVRISAQNDDGGYILSKFIDTQKKAPIGKIQESRGRFINVDRSEDTINNIHTDIGGCLWNPRFIKKKKYKNAWEYFARMLDLHSARLEKPRAIDVQAYLLEQKRKGVDILSPDFVNHMQLKKPDKAIAIKFLNSLRKVNLQKEKLLLSGDFKMIKKLLSEDASFVYSSHKSSSEEVIDVVRKFETYPALLAEELGISPVPVLENWAELYKKYGSSCDINLKNNYTKKDILEFVEKNYINIRNDESLMAKLKFELKLGKELAKLEKDYAQSDLGKAETGWDAFYDFMNRANK